MVVILDTRLVPAAERVDLWTETFTRAAPVEMRVEDPDRLSGLMHHWDLPELLVMKYAANTGVLFRQHDEGPGEQRFAFAAQSGGRGRLSQFGVELAAGPGKVVCVDMGRPFEMGWSGQGGSTSVNLSSAQLDLPARMIERAASHVDRSPLAPLVARHIALLGAGTLDDPATAGVVARATVDLCRALVLSVQSDL